MKLLATLRRSFAEILAQKAPQIQRRHHRHYGVHGSQNQRGLQFDFSLKELGEREGYPVVQFKAEEWRNLARDYENLTLIWKFLQKRPAIDIVRSVFQKSFPISRAAHIGVIDALHILI